MTNFWLSWYHRPDDGVFEIHSPWWVSGYAYDNEGNELPTIVAAVKADSEDEAWQFVNLSYDNPPDSIDARFCDEMKKSSPFSDRFPRAEWMQW